MRRKEPWFQKLEGKKKTKKWRLPYFYIWLIIQRVQQRSTSTHTNFRGCRELLYALFQQHFLKQPEIASHTCKILL